MEMHFCPCANEMVDKYFENLFVCGKSGWQLTFQTPTTQQLLCTYTEMKQKVSTHSNPLTRTDLVINAKPT